MSLFANLRKRFTDATGYYQYAPTHVWTGGAAGASLVGPELAPTEGSVNGVPNFAIIRFTPATEFQPYDVVVNGLGAAIEAQLVSDPLFSNGDPNLDGVSPYF